MTPCDTVVEALALALAWSKRKLPLVIRLAGQNAEYALDMLNNRMVAHHRADGIKDAVARAIKLAA